MPNVRRLKNHLKIFNCPQNCTALFTSITVIHRYRYPSFSRSLVLLLRNRKEKRTCAGARSSYLRNEKCITSSIESQAIVLSTVAVSLSSFSFLSTVIRFNELFTEIRFDYEYTILIITKHFNPSTFYFMNLTAAAPDSRSERN